MELAFRTRDTGKWITVTAPRDVVMTSRLLTGLALHRFPVHSGNAGQVVDYLAVRRSYPRNEIRWTGAERKCHTPAHGKKQKRRTAWVRSRRVI
jgi:hypothetical protein